MFYQKKKKKKRKKKTHPKFPLNKKINYKKEPHYMRKVHMTRLVYNQSSNPYLTLFLFIFLFFKSPQINTSAVNSKIKKKKKLFQIQRFQLKT